MSSSLLPLIIIFSSSCLPLLVFLASSCCLSRVFFLPYVLRFFSPLLFVLVSLFCSDFVLSCSYIFLPFFQLVFLFPLSISTCPLSLSLLLFLVFYVTRSLPFFFSSLVSSSLFPLFLVLVLRPRHVQLWAQGDFFLRPSTLKKCSMWTYHFICLCFWLECSHSAVLVAPDLQEATSWAETENDIPVALAEAENDNIINLDAINKCRVMTPLWKRAQVECRKFNGPLHPLHRPRHQTCERAQHT